MEICERSILSRSLLKLAFNECLILSYFAVSKTKTNSFPHKIYTDLTFIQNIYELIHKYYRNTF